VKKWDLAVWYAAGHKRAATAEAEVSTVTRPIPAPVAVAAPSHTGDWFTDSYDWMALARCETGANFHMHGPIYATAFGITTGASELTPAARNGTASPEEQLRIAIAVERRAGIRAWGCHAAAGG